MKNALLNSDIKLKMFVAKLDSFVQKFQQLWNAGFIAHLDLESCAGNAWVGLRLQLGHTQHPHHHRVPHSSTQVLKKVESPSRQRRRARRAAAAQLANAEQQVTPTEAAEDSGVIEKAMNDKSEDLNTVEETCKNTNSDEIGRNLESSDETFNRTEKPTYCRVCKEVCEEMATAEDISYHVMNNHETEEVTREYGNVWIDKKLHHVRQGSPFMKLKIRKKFEEFSLK
eukprot:GFUD01097580.1.p1 GENE.GFUD01097580.1~~GFUD01097580.1.p1  ORF type:complete len:227 (-),score=45.55 GFUD01097580.1:81-761(-)